jgi:hypothetical protein
MSDRVAFLQFVEESWVNIRFAPVWDTQLMTSDRTRIQHSQIIMKWDLRCPWLALEHLG